MSERFVAYQVPSQPASRETIVSHFPISQQERIDRRFKDAISPAEKDRIFSTSIKAMRELGSEIGVFVPDDLPSRLYVLKNGIYTAICQREVVKVSDENIGITLPNRLALVNRDRVQKNESQNSDTDNRLRAIGIHELWHTPDYKELWVPKGGSPVGINSYRRAGMSTFRPTETDHVREGLDLLSEGFIEYLAYKTIELAGETLPQDDSYYPELKSIAEALIKGIGIQPLVEAEFSKNGFRGLIEAIETTYGRGSTTLILNTLYKDHVCRIGSEMGLSFMPSNYPNTKSLLMAA